MIPAQQNEYHKTLKKRTPVAVSSLTVGLSIAVPITTKMYKAVIK